METSAQGASGYYVWEAGGKPFEVHIGLDVIEAMGVEIMRGFGLVPRRGAEVGGLLLGQIEHGEATIVRIEEFVSVPCGYARGPSYLLSPEEQEAFEATVQKLRPETGAANYAVGYFRSHTREGLALAPEDLELLERCFKDPSHIALLVKPYATKAGSAGFFFREEGAFQATTPQEFPFRRRELTGEEPPERRPLTGGRSRNRETRAPDRMDRADRAHAEDPMEEPAALDAPAEETDTSGYIYADSLPPRSRLGGSIWFPLSFVFLLVGLALGAWGALAFYPRSPVNSAQDVSLALAVQNSNGSLMVRWNGDSPALRSADHAVMEVHDGGYSKTLDLDSAQLHSGSLALQNSSPAVSFRLTVYLNPRLSVSETLDWHQ